jgi:hypothetical protein
MEPPGAAETDFALLEAIAFFEKPLLKLLPAGVGVASSILNKRHNAIEPENVAIHAIRCLP